MARVVQITGPLAWPQTFVMKGGQNYNNVTLYSRPQPLRLVRDPL
jgi:hypothetical protein